MRRLPWILLVLSLATPLAAGAGVPFIEGDVAQALAKARAEGRPVMVDVYAAWCGPCKELDARVFATQEAEKALGRFVALRVDAEKGAGPRFVEERNVVGYPTVLFLDSEGREIDRIFGTMPPADFIRTAKDYLAGRGTLAQAEQQFLEDRSGDLELAFDLLFRHAVRGNEREALGYLSLIDAARAGLSAGPASAPKAAASKRLAAMAAQGRYVLAKYLYLRGKEDFAEARDRLLALRKEFPKSEFASAALYDLAAAYEGLKQPAKAKEALDQYLASEGESASAASAYAWFSLKHRFEVDRGIEVARRGLEKAPRADELWDTLAGLYALKGDKAKAREANARSLALKPADPYYLERQAGLK